MFDHPLTFGIFLLSLIGVAAWISLLLPVSTYLVSGWTTRRNEFLQGLSEKAIELYFQRFHPQYAADGEIDLKDRFKKYYNSQFGRLYFLPPVILTGIVAAILLIWSVVSVSSWLDTGNINEHKAGLLPLSCVLGI